MTNQKNLVETTNNNSRSLITIPCTLFILIIVIVVSHLFYDSRILIDKIFAPVRFEKRSASHHRSRLLLPRCLKDLLKELQH